MTFDTTIALKTIQSLIQRLVVPPPSALSNRSTAISFQALLAPLQSNSDPANPGLAEIFREANANLELVYESGATDPATLVQIQQWLHDSYASYEALQYLLRVSNGLGFVGPAQQFYATFIPTAKQWRAVSPIAVPGGAPPPIAPPSPTPGPTPSPTPLPTPTPPSPSPIGGVPSPPANSPAPPIPQFWRSAVQTGVAGSGEPYNGISLIALMHLNSVYVPVYARTTSATSTDATWADENNDPTIINGVTDQYINAYNATNLAVIVSLEIDCDDGTARTQFRPSNPIEFLNNLNVLALQLAKTADRVGADAICIAPQVFPYSGLGDNPAQYMPQWRTIVQTIRSVFNGPILYFADPNNAGPIGGQNAMDWNLWDAVGVVIAPPTGLSTTTATIQAYWQTAIDTEGSAGYNTPIFGNQGWLRSLHDQWAPSGRKIWIHTGVQGQGI